jgi:hypothetical protein
VTGHPWSRGFRQKVHGGRREPSGASRDSRKESGGLAAAFLVGEGVLMARRALMCLACLWLWFGSGLFDRVSFTQQIGRTPVEVQVLAPPVPAAALGRVHLVYELHLTNFGAAAATLERIDVLDGTEAALTSWSGPQLWARIRVLGQADPAAPTGVLPPGSRAVVYAWLTLPAGQAAPATLVHRLMLSDALGERATETTPALRLAAGGAAIEAPVRGGPWVAVRGPSNGSAHRMSFVTLDGRTRVPQRFAVDWALLGDDGLLFHGERSDVRNWYGYDAPVHAAAAGTVVLVRDGQPDHRAFDTAVPAVMDASAATGNTIVIDMGQGRYATYAHLKPGSLRVHEGERVAAGQEIARIGNSGNTLGPHLHFQISDAAEPLGGEGLPFALQSFDLVGRIASLPALLNGQPWTPSAAQPPRAVTAELPLENMVIRFAGPGR